VSKLLPVQALSPPIDSICLQLWCIWSTWGIRPQIRKITILSCTTINYAVIITFIISAVLTSKIWPVSLGLFVCVLHAFT